jgi:ribosome-associated toxin RatA of RatAB toxin-antitoxin module
VRSTTSIQIDAPAGLVFDLAHDVERWPALLPHYLRVDPIRRHEDGALTTRMVAVRRVVPVLGLGIPVAWRARTWHDRDALRLRFVHLGGATAGMDVTWRIEPTGAGCAVSIDHEFRPAFPGWAFFVDRLFVQPIAGQTLRTFKAIAEAVAARSATPRKANTST